MHTRRFILAAGALTAASAAAARILPAGLPMAGPPAPPPPPNLAWVVGTPGEFDWEAIRAPTREDAVRAWLDSSGWEPECEVECPAGQDPETWEPEPLTECVCGKCCLPDVEAQRVPSFDAIRNPTPGDWIRAGIGHTCSRCHEEAGPDTGAAAIGDQCVCDDCLTPDERRAALRAAERRMEIRNARRALLGNLDALTRSAGESGVTLKVSGDAGDLGLDHIERKGAAKGEGAAVMRRLCEIADGADTPIRLYAFGAEPRIISYYEGFGFTADPGADGEAMMVRLPREPATEKEEQ